MMTICILLVADSLFGISADRINAMLDARKKFSESLAIQSTLLIHNNETILLEQFLQNVVLRNEDILSAAVREIDGNLLTQQGDHVSHWQQLPLGKSTIQYVQVPIFKGTERWGTMEISFKYAGLAGTLEITQNPFVRLLAFVALTGFVVFLIYMKRTLRYLDPAAVIPQRVKTALDGLVEGIILVDETGHIVLANNPFALIVDQTSEQLLGQNASDLNWVLNKEDHMVHPWITAIKEGTPQTGVHMSLARVSDKNRSFIVNSAPIFGNKDEVRGAFISFDDVTELEQKNVQLHIMLAELEASREKILIQNEELTQLATRDPLTGCLNRRAFFEMLNAEYFSSIDSGKSICCIMADIDLFKSFNDTYGHAVGDQVIQIVAKTLASTLRANDLFCRYGGEEFCIMLMDIDQKTSLAIAERMRSNIESQCGAGIRTTSGLKVTASFGISTTEYGASEPTELIDQADKALYTSKEQGRNRVSRWPQPRQEIKLPQAERLPS